MKSTKEILKGIENWAVRASSASLYVTNPPGLTPTQELKMHELAERKKKAKKGEAKPLTVKMEKDLETLIEKQNEADVLPDGAKNEVERELDRIMYGIDPDVSSKELEKGIECEQDSLQLFQDVYNEQHGTKIYLGGNDTRIKKDGLIGKPDQLYGEHVIEIKSPFNLDTFRRADLEDAGYYWQCQTYMHLTGQDKAILAYCLVDTPEQILYQMWRKQLYWQKILDEDSEAAKEIEQKVRNEGTFTDKIRKENRVRWVQFTYNEEDVQLLIDRAALAKEYMLESFEQRMQGPEIIIPIL